MKVMHLLASNQYSGAEHVVIDIIKNSDACGIYVSPRGSIDKALRKNNISHHFLNAFSYGEIFAFIKEYAPDVVHAHDYKASCMVALMPIRAKLVSHIHNTNVWAKQVNLRTILYSICSVRFAKIAVVSESVVREFVFNRIFRNKVIVIKNIIDEQEIYDKAYVPNQYNSDFLFVGRLSTQKNPLRFVHLIKKMTNFRKDVTAIMVGVGEVGFAVEKEIEKLALQNNIKMVGFQDNPYKFMRCTKSLVITSIWEGFGLVALEAMLLGKRVYTTAVGGVQEIVGGYNKQWVVNTDDGFIKDMLEALQQKKYDYSDSYIKEYAHRINDVDKFKQQIEALYK